MYNNCSFIWMHTIFEMHWSILEYFEELCVKLDILDQFYHTESTWTLTDNMKYLHYIY